MIYVCAKFGDCTLAVLILWCGQTDRQTVSQTDRIKHTDAGHRVTLATVVGVSKYAGTQLRQNTENLHNIHYADWTVEI